MKQSDKLTAYYFRAAQQIDTLYLDNQMQKLLCYARESRLKSYLLYVDTRVSGITLDRPAMSGMIAGIRDRKISRIVVTDTARIARNISGMMEFFHLAGKYDVDITVIDENITVDSFLLLSCMMEGGGLK